MACQNTWEIHVQCSQSPFTLDAKKEKHKRRTHTVVLTTKEIKVALKCRARRSCLPKRKQGHDIVLAPEFVNSKHLGRLSNSTMHNFPLAGRSGMMVLFLIHLIGLFLLWPSASVSNTSAGRTHRRACLSLCLIVPKNIHTWNCKEPDTGQTKRQNAKGIKCRCHLWKCRVCSGERKKREQNYSNTSRPQGMWPGSVYRQAQHVITHSQRNRGRKEDKGNQSCTASLTDSREDGR